MKGLSSKSIRSIQNIINLRFDSVSLNLLGLISPQIKSKNIIFTTRQNLISLFLQGLGTRKPNKNEEDALKVLLSIANNYVESLKEKTVAKTTHEIDAYVKQLSLKKQPVQSTQIKSIVDNNMEIAMKHIKLIANHESNKAVNTGTALKISKIGEQKDEDPIVFFVVTIDERNDPETYRLHLLPDRLTPRVYKLSELGTEYHKKGDTWPKVQGTNPNCFVGNKGVQILTEQGGYKNIKDVQIGERVLTHTGKFKKVINTLEWYGKKYYSNFIKIKYKGAYRDGFRTHTLRVTPDHKFLTQRGWVEAKDLKATDSFKQLFTKCAYCGSKTYVKPKRKKKGKKNLEGFFCNNHCVTNFNWSDPTKSQLKEDVTRLSSNHTNNYFFEDVALESVEFIKNHKGGYKLYDLTVEDDESFVVNGIVSHNCRCKLTYLAKGFGFKDGKVAFKGLAWDEYSYQRKTYGLPPKLK